MPTIICASKIRAVSDHYKLSLVVRHRLAVGNSSDVIYKKKNTRFLEEIIVPCSNLVFTISGTMNDTPIPPMQLEQCELSRHLVEFFRKNAGELGLRTISDLYVDKDDSLLKTVLTPTQLFSPGNTSICLTLIGLDLHYIWETVSSDAEMACHPFSYQLSLPFLTLLDNVVRRFVTYQLVRRYPLIFGFWLQQFSIETQNFLEISISINSIMQRSSNVSSRRRFRSITKSIDMQRENASVALASLVAAWLEPILANGLHLGTTRENDTNIYACMENLFKIGMRSTRFKGSALSPTADDDDDDELSQERPPFSQAEFGILNDSEPWDSPSAPLRIANMLASQNISDSSYQYFTLDSPDKQPRHGLNDLDDILCDITDRSEKRDLIATWAAEGFARVGSEFGLLDDISASASDIPSPINDSLDLDDDHITSWDSHDECSRPPKNPLLECPRSYLTVLNCNAHWDRTTDSGLDRLQYHETLSHTTEHDQSDDSVASQETNRAVRVVNDMGYQFQASGLYPVGSLLRSPLKEVFSAPDLPKNESHPLAQNSNFLSQTVHISDECWDDLFEDMDAPSCNGGYLGQAPSASHPYNNGVDPEIFSDSEFEYNTDAKDLDVEEKNADFNGPFVPVYLNHSGLHSPVTCVFDQNHSPNLPEEKEDYRELVRPPSRSIPPSRAMATMMGKRCMDTEIGLESWEYDDDRDPLIIIDF